MLEHILVDEQPNRLILNFSEDTKPLEALRELSGLLVGYYYRFFYSSGNNGPKSFYLKLGKDKKHRHEYNFDRVSFLLFGNYDERIKRHWSNNNRQSILLGIINIWSEKNDSGEYYMSFIMRDRFNLHLPFRNDLELAVDDAQNFYKHVVARYTLPKSPFHDNIII